MNKLRDEIIEAQKARFELLKWKLVIVSIVGAAALGIHRETHAVLAILALIPLASLYVDIVCYHLALRTIVIGSFLKSFAPDTCGIVQTDDVKIYRSYEKFAFYARGTKIVAFDLEDWALWQSTLVLSAFVFVAGIYNCFSPAGDAALLTDIALLVSGALGTWCSHVLFRRFKSKCAALEALTADECPPA
jgi:hypothetical protein